MLEFLFALLLQYKYLVLVSFSFMAQPALGMLAGALARFDLMDVRVVYAVLVLAALAGDIAWYWIGYRWGENFARRYGRFVSIRPKHVEIAKRFFHQYHASILFASKITNGFGLAIVTLFTAGLTRVPFGRYFVYNLIGEVVWSAFVVGVGYFFGDLYVRVDDALGRVSITAGLLLFLAIAFGAGRYFYKKLAKRLEAAGD